MIAIIMTLALLSFDVQAKGKIYEPKDPKYGKAKNYTRSQQIQRGTRIPPKMVTCRLKKRVKAKNGDEVCIYKGQNKTYELSIEKNCPRQYKCEYNPWGQEPNIYSVIDSLNESVK